MIKSKTLRFHEENMEDMKAWNYLNKLNSKKFKSQNKFMIQAIIEFYERQEKIEEDPYFEKREKEEAFINRIVTEVERKAFEKLSGLSDMNLSHNMSGHLHDLSGNDFQSRGGPTKFTESDEIESNIYIDLDAFG